MERVTPQALLEQFKGLPLDDRTAFLRLLSQTVRAGELFLVVSEMRPAERELYFRALHEVVLAAANSSKDLDLDSSFDEWFETKWRKVEPVIESHLNRHIAQHVREYKHRRDRKSSPDIVRRNVLICDLRNQDREKWSLGRLAKRYGVSTRAITRVLKEEAKWRRLMSELGTE